MKEVGDSANQLMPFRVEFELKSIFGQVYLPSTRHQPTYLCYGYGFFWGTEFCTPTRTPEKPVAKPTGFVNPCSSLPICQLLYQSSLLKSENIGSQI